MKEKFLTGTLTALLMLFSGSNAWSQEGIRTTYADQIRVGITLYNNNLALVRDRRQVILEKGPNTVAFMDVSAEIQPETAFLRNLSHPEDFSVSERNYAFDLLTPQALLQNYIGRKVGVISRHPTTGEKTIDQATLLAANQGIVVRLGDRIRTGISPDRLVYQAIPKTLRVHPTLILQLHTAAAGKQALELNYLTSGLSWKVDYVARLNQNQDRLNLKGWATLTNQSGTTYRNAHLQLVAGHLHRVALERKYGKRRAVAFAQTVALPEEGLSDYHLYTLERTTTLQNNQTKQVALLSAYGIPAQKHYELRSRTPSFYQSPSRADPVSNPPVKVYLHFNNTKKAGLGLPLPAGIIRVYQQDPLDPIQFVGEDRINHTAKNRPVELLLGQAFDITSKKRRTGYHKLGSHSFEATFEILLRNAKQKPVTVKVVEFIPGDWHIFSENYPHQRRTASTAVWRLFVPASGQTTLTVSFRTET